MMSRDSQRVLHVTESMSTGVLTFIESLSRRQSEAGAAVAVLYSVRPETPSREALERRFSDAVELITPIDHGSTARNAIALLRETRRAARSGDFDVIHLHSSIGGAVGRVASWGTRTRTAYSPHGFGFLRENTSALVRRGTLMAERMLSRRGTLIVTSASEVEIARERLGATDVRYLQSGVPSSSIPAPRARRDVARPRVTMVGRIAYQKAPWRFAAVATELGAIADFVWVGGGAASDRERWIGSAPVTVHEWVSLEELDEILDGTDILLFPTLWEGMSLSLIQAQSRGIPAVTSDIVGNRDAVRDGVTGFVRNDDAGFVEATRELIQDDALRLTMGEAARRWIQESFTDDRMGQHSLAIYQDMSRTTTG